MNTKDRPLKKRGTGLSDVKLVPSLFFLCLVTSCEPFGSKKGTSPLHSPKSWNEARESFFKSNKSLKAIYRVDGVRGEVIDVRVYPSPSPRRMAVTFGETYFNTTGWPVHLTLMETNEMPIYPGNVFVFDVDSRFTLEWEDDRSLVVYMPKRSFPTPQAFRLHSVERLADSYYGKSVSGVMVKFLPVDDETFATKQDALRNKDATTTN